MHNARLQRDKGCDKPTQALEIDDVLSLALKGITIQDLLLKIPAASTAAAMKDFIKRLDAAHAPSEEQPGLSI